VFTKHRIVQKCVKLVSLDCNSGHAAMPMCLLLGVSLIYTTQRVKQIAYWKQRETKNNTPQIDAVTDAILYPPMHPRKQVKCFRDMSKNDQFQTTCTDQL